MRHHCVGYALACPPAGRFERKCDPPPAAAYENATNPRAFIACRLRPTDSAINFNHKRPREEPQDFRILDDGKEREIASFVVERANPAGAESARPRLIALVFDDIAFKMGCGSINVRPNFLAVASIAQMKDAGSPVCAKVPSA